MTFSMALGLSSCNSTMGDKQTLGSVVGGVSGAVIGSQFGHGSGQVFAAATGAILGGLIGSEIGAELDEADKIKAEQAFKQATNAKIGETVHWHNQRSGHHGSIKPLRDGTSTSGLYCREFQTTVIIDSNAEKMNGTACRQPNGEWRMQT